MLTSLGVGGTERQVLALGSRMAAKGHSVTVLVLRSAQPGDFSTGLEVIHLDLSRTPVGLFKGLLRGRRCLRTLRPEVLHSHNFHGNILARLLRRFCAVPVLISTIHNVYEGGRLRMLAYRLTDRFATLTTAVSAAAAQRFLQLKSVKPSKCIVVSNGIDTSEFRPDEQRREAARAHMGVTSEFVWFASGRITPAKDYPNLLSAFTQVHALQPNAQLWIAGPAQGGSRPNLETFAIEPERQQHIFWLGPRSDIPPLLDAADGFVLSSAWEGMPLALGEAMAMQKPVVATDVGGVKELVGDAGLIVPSKNPTALAQAMLKVMEQSVEQRASCGRAARSRICDLFSMDAKAEQWESLYRSVLLSRGGAS